MNRLSRCARRSDDTDAPFYEKLRSVKPTTRVFLAINRLLLLEDLAPKRNRLRCQSDPLAKFPAPPILHWIFRPEQRRDKGGFGGKKTVTRHQVGSRNPDTRFDRTYSSVRVHGPKVTVVQKRHGRQHQSRSSPQRARGNPCGCFGVVGPTRAAKIQTLLASRIRCILTDQWTRYR